MVTASTGGGISLATRVEDERPWERASGELVKNAKSEKRATPIHSPPINGHHRAQIGSILLVHLGRSTRHVQERNQSTWSTVCRPLMNGNTRARQKKCGDLASAERADKRERLGGVEGTSVTKWPIEG